jgi:predicted MFS family arabinose efflux permease
LSAPPAPARGDSPAAASGPAVALSRLVPCLGVGQIIAWGTLFYSIAVLGPPMARAIGASDTVLYGSFTAGLFVSGLVAPWTGRSIDRRGGRPVLVLGSVIAGIACILLAVAHGAATMATGWIVAGAAMGMGLYDAAFATLHRVSGTSYRRAVTALTLFGGFASTVFWPLSQFLLERHGWRAAFGVHAALNLAVALPLYAIAVPGAARRSPGTMAVAARPVARGTRRAFVWLATALSIAAFLAAGVSAHLVTLLGAGGIAPRDAVLAGALIGPMQVAGRLMEFAFSDRLRPLAVGTLAFALMAGALVVLALVHGAWIVALLFALLYGWSNGVLTIVRGTVPGVLFGERDYGALLGRLARPQFMLKSVAPLVVTLLAGLGGGGLVPIVVLAGGGIAALASYRLAIRASR